MGNFLQGVKKFFTSENAGKSFGSSLMTGGISSAVGLANNALGSFINNLFARKNMKLQYDYNRRAYDYQMDSQRRAKAENWQLYDSPLAQRRALEDAGLNAGLMYGNGAGGSASGLSAQFGSSSIAHASYGGAPSINPLLAAELKVAESVANKNNADADNIRGNTSTSQSQMALNNSLTTLNNAKVDTEKALKGHYEALKAYNNILTDINQAQHDANSEDMTVTVTAPNGEVVRYTTNGYKLNLISDSVNLFRSSSEAFMKSKEAEHIVDTILTQLRYYGAQADLALTEADARRLENELKQAVQTAEFVKEYGEKTRDSMLKAIELAIFRATNLLNGGTGLTQGEMLYMVGEKALDAIGNILTAVIHGKSFGKGSRSTLTSTSVPNLYGSDGKPISVTTTKTLY